MGNPDDDLSAFAAYASSSADARDFFLWSWDSWRVFLSAGEFRLTALGSQKTDSRFPRAVLQERQRTA